jgi:hypothetical protein
MRTVRLALFPLILLCLHHNARAQYANLAASTEIKAVMQKSADDWNRGNLNAFVACYKKSPDILLIGTTISRGYDSMLQTYRTYYRTKEKMGVLSYSDLEVQSSQSEESRFT